MEIVNRYVYAVVKQLPKEVKEEVEKEVKLLIYDRMESCSEDVTKEEKAIRVIEKLGNPDRLADKYRVKERYLIGPKYFSKYLLVLKIVLYSVYLGMTVVFFMDVIVNKEIFLTTLTNFIQTLLSALLQGVAWVTLIFAIFEYKSVNLVGSLWSIKDLPEVPHKKTLISRGESIFTIIFSAIFFSGLYFVPELIGIYYKDNATWASIPIFNVDILNNYKIIIILIFIVTLLEESLKIIWEKWTCKRAIVCSFISVLSSGLTIILFINKSIWNSQLSNNIYKYTKIEMSSITNLIVTIIVFATIIEIVTSLYKGFKYGN